MALHPQFSTSPYAPLVPEQRWFPADVVAFAKNYYAVGFRLDYVRASGDLSNYVPDFIVRTADNAAEENGQRHDFVFVDQLGYEKHLPKTFAALAGSFTEYKP
jgi:type III restriction enzyme